MTLGFIGAGNMASAILQGAVSQKFLSPESIFIYDVVPAQCNRVMAAFPGVQTSANNGELVCRSDVIVLAVKPVYLEGVLQEIRPFVRGKRLISIAAGWTSAMLGKALGPESGAQVLRVSPNTPALVGEGFTALCEESTFDAEALQWATALFQTLGATCTAPERLFNALIAVSGSSPAYVYMFIEAMADGAVKLGLSRALAYQAAAQSVLGAAKMVLETGEHPGKLKDDVCSPGGTTIEAVYQLERGGMRSAVITAMEACAAKCEALEAKQK